jgi:hypothetical protein
MFSSLLVSGLRRTAVVAVLATAASTAFVSGAAVSAGAHATSLSIRAAHQAVAPGGSDVITGSLRVGTGQALPGKTVTLEARVGDDADFLPVGTAVSGPSGGVALTVTPADTTRYRWVFAGDDVDLASHSGVLTVKVRVPAHPPTRLATSLSIRVAHPMVNLAGNDTISGRLSSHRKALRHKIVALISRVDGSTTWSFVKAKRTGKRGGVVFGVHPTASSHYRLVFGGTPNFRRARSAVVHVAIRSTALSIATTPTSVGGVLTNNGTAYAGQTVQLWGKPVGTRKFAALSSAVTAADGSVSFTVAPVKSMRYFLFFPRTTDAPAARSATRTIAVS